MNEICKRLLGRHLLWHAAETVENADAICQQGFRLSRRPVGGRCLRVRFHRWFSEAAWIRCSTDTTDRIANTLRIET